MSLGSTYNNNQSGNKFPDLSIYSNYRMNNAESQIDPTCITMRFWKSNLCIGIYPRKNTGNDQIQFDMDNGITIYLTHSKARILANELKLFLSDPIKYNGVGAASGAAAITISNGIEYGKNTPVLTIRKVDESGKVISSFAYEFKTNYYYGIRNYDGNTFDSAYDEYKYMEVEQLITLLEEYIKASTNAIAFTVMEQRKYSDTRTNSKIDAIAQKLGVDISSNGGGQRSYNNKSYFNNSTNNGSNNGTSYPSTNNVSYGAATIDDLE